MLIIKLLILILILMQARVAALEQANINRLVDLSFAFTRLRELGAFVDYVWSYVGGVAADSESGGGGSSK